MSKIVLYRNCRILEDKNMQVDDILTYLGTLSTPKVYNNAQLIKNVNDVDLSIKVALDQDYMEKDVVNNYNYCSISNDTSNADTYFYFIRKINWKSKECLELELHLDVLNTFKGEYTLTDKTTIQRMHKDRFVSKVDRSWSKTGYLDELDVWDWSSDVPGEMVGRATFNLSDDFIGEDFNKDLVIFEYDQEPYARNLWEFNRDVINNTITITMYIQSEQIPQQSYGVFIAYKSLLRDVDYIDEGITPLLYKKSDETIYDETGMNWYTIYTGTYDLDADIPFNTYLQAEKPCMVTHKTSEGGLIDSGFISSSTTFIEIDASKFITSGSSYRIYSSVDGTHWNEIGKFKYTTYQPYGKAGICDIIQLRKDANSNNLLLVQATQYIKMKPAKGVVTSYNISQEINVGNYIRFEGITTVKYHTSNETITRLNWSNINSSSVLTRALSEPIITSVQLKGVNSIDRTNSKLIKMIELPYAPATIAKDNNGDFVLNNNELSIWSYEDENIPWVVAGESSNAFKLNTYGVDIKLEQDIISPINPLDDFKLYIPTINTSQNRNDACESKLYNSDYHYYKFIYDSFNYSVPLQYINATDSNKFTINFRLTNTANSKFLFTFKDVHFKYSTQDYDNIMVVSRNNEITLSSSAYLNYMRNSYNYDVKAKYMDNLQTGFSLTGGLVGSLISASSGNYAGAIGGLFNNLSGSIMSLIKREDAMNRNLQQLQAQAGSVSGADDIDLLRAYTNGNKMKVCLYECSDNMKQKVADLFYYCGYNVGLQAVPNTTSRYWFNFIQCLPVYDQANNLAKLNKQQLDELTNKYQNGVTVYHHHTTWDFDQVKENWETSLLA